MQMPSLRSKVNLDALKKQAESNTTRGAKDPNAFTYTLNNEGFFEAIVKFLPSVDHPENLPYITRVNHKFPDRNGQQVRHACRSAIGEDCPTCKFNAPRWVEGDGEKDPIVKQAQEEYRKYKKKFSYCGNIVVIKCPSNPQMEGKVFLLWWDVIIQGMIDRRIAPPKDSVEKADNPFAWDSLSFFKLRYDKQGKFNTSKASSWLVESEYRDWVVNNAVAIDAQIHNIYDKHTEALKYVKTYDETANILYKATGHIAPDWAPVGITAGQAPSQAPAGYQPSQAPAGYQPASQPATQAPSQAPAGYQPAQAPASVADVAPVQQKPLETDRLRSKPPVVPVATEGGDSQEENFWE